MNRSKGITLNSLKIAVVHQSYWSERGQERLLKAVLELVPLAQLFLLFGDKELIAQKLARDNVHFSWLQKLPFIKRFYRYTLPLWPLAYEMFDFKEYDLVISLSSSFAKGVVTGPFTKHISIITTPTRYLWDMSSEYYKASDSIKKKVMKLFYTPLRIWDILSARRPDKIIAISNFIKQRILKYYRIEAATVIYPPVEYEAISQKTLKKEDFYIAISPFEENKRGDLIIQLAQKTGIKIKLLGNGSQFKKLKAAAKGYPNIEFVGWVSDEAKHNLMKQAKGLIYPGIEDFGIVPVEAIYCGCPVLAFAQGGALESVVDGKTGVFIYEQSVEALEEGLERLKGLKFDLNMMQASVAKFAKSKFLNQFEQFIKSELRE
ncbi:MAG: glycosyltransferase family 4 protein [Candidatus Dojkabacteria bacterium]